MKAIALGAAALMQLLAIAPASAQFLDPAEQPSRLLPYTRCPLGGGLAPTEVKRAPDLPMARPVETASGKKRVSVADGYRVMLAFPDTDPFVNLKVELSMPGQYAIDKQTILEQMEHLAKTARGGAVKVERSFKAGIDIVALNPPGIGGGTISVYTLFDDKEGVIATAYLLNQRPAHRVFQNYAQYRSLAGDFIEAYSLCMSKNRR